MSKNIAQSFNDLKTYLEDPPLDERYKGFDPFDGLKSVLFRKSIFNNSRLSRLAWLQFHKLSPINFRRILKVETGYNPQALALFILGYGKLYNRFRVDTDLGIINFLANKLLEIRSRGWSGSCWGYNFDWQARAFLQPAYTPMIVPTTYAVEALFEAATLLNDENFTKAALDSVQFVVKDLNRTEKDSGFAFSYSPLDKTVVYNASLMASRLLAQVYARTGHEEYLKLAKASVSYCIEDQAQDGSWHYGEKPYHQWIDNFHTGYNLECIKMYSVLTNDKSFEQNIESGFQFYINTFFQDEGKSRYYINKTYPIDINNPAQLIITLIRLGKFREYENLARSVLRWTIQNMQSKEGYFYYQVRRFYKNRINYMRWSQAWMFYSLSEFISNIDG